MYEILSYASSRFFVQTSVQSD